MGAGSVLDRSEQPLLMFLLCRGQHRRHVTLKLAIVYVVHAHRKEDLQTGAVTVIDHHGWRVGPFLDELSSVLVDAPVAGGFKRLAVGSPAGRNLCPVGVDVGVAVGRGTHAQVCAKLPVEGIDHRAYERTYRETRQPLSAHWRLDGLPQQAAAIVAQDHPVPIAFVGHAAPYLYSCRVANHRAEAGRRA